MKTEVESKLLLRKYGIATTNPQVATAAAMAAALVANAGRPCALKVVSADIVHKAAAGGVRLSVTERDAPQAFDDIMEACRSSHSDARIEGVLVEEMVGGKLEVFIGARFDRDYGPVVLLGPGGSNVERGREPVAALAPIDRHMAVRLIEKAFPESGGDPDGESRDALVGCLLAVAGAEGLVIREPIDELDINPVILDGSTAIAVDAVASDAADTQGNSFRSAPEFEAAAERRRERLGGLGALFDPSSIAVIGASTQKEKLGYRVIRNLLDFGFNGTIYPIHPSADRICDLQAYRSVDEVPGPVDRAYVAVANRLVPAVLAQCRDKGVKVAQVLTAGFSEYSHDAGGLEEAMLAEVRSGPMRMVGPNCIGTFSASSRMALAAPRFSPTEPGVITFFSQSGTFAGDIVRRAKVWGLPVGRALSCGNCADLDPIDYLLYADADPATRIIAFYLESLPEPGLFFRAAERIGKPIVILRGGGTEQGFAAAASHTAALATSRLLWSAGLKQAGILQVDSIDELMDSLLVLSAHNGVGGNQLGIFGSGGGVSVTSSDAAARAGLVVPRLDAETQNALTRFGVPGTSVSNPIDIPVWGLKDGDDYILEDIINLLKADSNVDSIIVYVETGSVLDFADSDAEGLRQLNDICDSVARARRDGPPVSLALRSSGDQLQDNLLRQQRVRLLDKGIAVFGSTARAVRAQAMLLEATRKASA